MQGAGGRLEGDSRNLCPWVGHKVGQQKRRAKEQHSPAAWEPRGADERHPLISPSCSCHCTLQSEKRFEPALPEKEMSLPSPSPWALLLPSTSPSFLPLLPLEPHTELERKPIQFKTKQWFFAELVLTWIHSPVYFSRQERALWVKCLGKKGKERKKDGIFWQRIKEKTLHGAGGWSLQVQSRDKSMLPCMYRHPLGLQGSALGRWNDVTLLGL